MRNRAVASNASSHPRRTRRGAGLGLLPGRLRLPIVILAIVLCQFITQIPTAVAAMAMAVALVILNFRLRFRMLFAAAVFTTFVFLLIGNWLFSPAECTDTSKVFVFVVNSCGFNVGLLHASRRTAMVMLGFAWLNSSTTAELSEVFLSYSGSLRLGRSAKRYILASAHLFVRLAEDYAAATRAITVHLTGAPVALRRVIRLRLRISVLKLSAITLRLFDSVTRIAFAAEAHFPARRLTADHHIVLENVTARYWPHSAAALHDVSLTIRCGDRVFLAGDSGAGKSALLRVIARYIPAIQGQVFGQVRVADTDWLDKELALECTLSTVKLVTEDPLDSLIAVTVSQEVMCHTHDLAAALTAVAEMGLREEWDTEVAHLSGGQKARLILACLLASEAKVVLLDNVTAQLDAAAREVFGRALGKYLDASKATLIVTDPFVEYFSPIVRRVVKLSSGRIVMDVRVNGSPLDKLLLGDIWADFPRWEIVPTMTRSVVCEARDVTVRLNGKTIVEGFSFTVSAGEVVALVGPNGSGKTTAMLALTGAIPLGGGTVEITGGAGMSFQDPNGQMLAATVGGELRVRPLLLGTDAHLQDAIVHDETRWLGIDEGKETLELEQRFKRLLSVSSMTFGSKFLVLDEPSADLHGRGLWALWHRLLKLASEGVGVVIVTHDPVLISRATRVVDISH